MYCWLVDWLKDGKHIGTAEIAFEDKATADAYGKRYMEENIPTWAYRSRRVTIYSNKEAKELNLIA